MKIEKSIPIPSNSAKKGKSKYPFNKLDVKESFIVQEKKRFSVATLAKKFGDSQEPLREFSVRLDEKGIMRCWRIK